MVSESQSEMMTGRSGPFLREKGEKLEQFETVRVRFRKVGHLQYISHLDLQRSMMRILVRAGIPVWYTQGFNPHAKIVFALPLPIGVQSVCELMDIRLDRQITCDEVKDRLNKALTDEMQVTSVYKSDIKFTDIGYAVYAYSFDRLGQNRPKPEEVVSLLKKPDLFVQKHTKAGEKEVCLADVLDEISSDYEGNKLNLKVRLSCGTNRETVSPVQVTEAITKAFALYENEADERIENMRVEIQDMQGKPFV